MVKLDKKDLKLLYYLSRDARQSHTQLAKKVGLAKNSIKYRIDRLMKEGVIFRFTSLVNGNALGFFSYVVLFKFNQDPSKSTQIIDYLRNHKNTIWIASLTGQYDLLVEFEAKSIPHLTKTIYEVADNFGEELFNYKVLISHKTLRVEHLIRDLYEGLNLPAPGVEERTTETNKLDSTDLRILNEFNNDPVCNIIDLADKLSLAPDTVRYRLKNMFKNKTIIKVFPTINLKNLGYTEYLYILDLKNTTALKIEQLNTFLMKNNNITYAYYDSVSNSIVITCGFKNQEGIDELSRSIRNKFADILLNQEYYHIKEHLYFNLCPKGILA